jgi:hypothetical protein
MPVEITETMKEHAMHALEVEDVLEAARTGRNPNLDMLLQMPQEVFQKNPQARRLLEISRLPYNVVSPGMVQVTDGHYDAAGKITGVEFKLITVEEARKRGEENRKALADLIRAQTGAQENSHLLDTQVEEALTAVANSHKGHGFQRRGRANVKN